MRLATVIVAWNGEAFLDECLASVLTQSDESPVVVVDNASEDRSLEIIRTHAARARQEGRHLDILESSTNEGFVAGANRGMEHLLQRSDPPEVIFLLNQDASLEPGALAALAHLFGEEQRAGVAGCKILDPEGKTLRHAGGYLQRPRMLGFHRGQSEKDRPGKYEQRDKVDYVTGAALAVRRECLEEVGLFDPVFSPGYYEDVDLCARAQERGWGVFYCPEAAARHAESASFSDWSARQSLAHRNRLLFLLRRLGEHGFLVEFAPVERRYLSECGSFDEMRTLAAAYVLAILRLPQVRDLGGSSTASSGSGSVLGTLESLRALVVGRLEDLRAWRPSPRAGTGKDPTLEIPPTTP